MLPKKLCLQQTELVMMTPDVVCWWRQWMFLQNLQLVVVACDARGVVLFPAERLSSGGFCCLLLSSLR